MAKISGVGAYVPPKIITNFDLEKMVDTSDEWIRTRTGIAQRHVVDEKTTTSDLALEASTMALEDGGLEAKDLDCIICATITPDYPFPATACVIQSKLGITGCCAFDISAGCSGFVYALSMAEKFVLAGTYKNILVVGAETLSKVTDWKDRGTCVLFGDGAGAVIVTKGDGPNGILSTYLGADGRGAETLMIPAGGGKTPITHQLLDDRLNYIKMSGNEVFKFAVNIMAEASLKTLKQCNIDPADVDWFIPHQANIRIINAAGRKLGIDESRVVVNVDRYGNTSAASIPIALHEKLENNEIKDGDVLVLVGFGAGLTWASSVIRWGDR